MNLSNWKLKDLQLHKDPQWDSYYLSAVYEVEEDDGFYEVPFQRIDLPVHFGMPSQTFISDWGGLVESTIDLGFGELEVRARGLRKKIRDKVKEMTMADIEKAIGCKVKIVSEDKINDKT